MPSYLQQQAHTFQADNLAKSSFVEDLFRKHYNEDNEDSTRQSLARPIFDFIMAAKKQFVNFFSNGKII